MVKTTSHFILFKKYYTLNFFINLPTWLFFVRLFSKAIKLNVEIVYIWRWWNITFLRFVPHFWNFRAKCSHMKDLFWKANAFSVCILYISRIDELKFPENNSKFKIHIHGNAFKRLKCLKMYWNVALFPNLKGLVRSQINFEKSKHALVGVLIWKTIQTKF